MLHYLYYPLCHIPFPSTVNLFQPDEQKATVRSTAFTCDLRQTTVPAV